MAARILAVACSSLVLVGCIGYGIAAAGGGAAENDSFGLVAADASAADSSQTGSSQKTAPELDASSDASEEVVLTSTASRDISQGIQDLEEAEAAEREAAEAARVAEERAHIEAAERARADQLAKAGQDAMASLSEVDWEVGKDAFIAEWTQRIDAYLEGSPLAGKGSVFASAAWEYGVDPRWSPAISNTESSKGAHCFASYNAWGWGKSGWSSWDEAIYAHVRGLANNYGYTISYSFAKKYCPPNYDKWFNSTLSEMKRI